MSRLASLTERLRQRHSLTDAEACEAAHLMAGVGTPASEKQEFLRALGDKGESASEVAAFAAVFRELARRPPVASFASEALDIVGTGGDRAGTFNISTLASLIVSAAGVPVMKHGGRSVTSKSGSADLLERLGVNLDADDATHARALEVNRFTFFFAPNFHPAFAAVRPIRAELAKEGRKSIFNLLGPLINPGRPAHMMIGVFDEAWVCPVAAALETLGVRRGLVVHGSAPDGVALDELSSCGPCRVRGAGELRALDGMWLPGDFGLPVAPFSDLKGGDAEENLAMLNDFLNGAAPRGLQDSVVLNAGAALFTAGRSPSVRDGMILAGDLLASGAVRARIREIREFHAR